ncbi:5-formyltetrahydrofolate cyclo-ligase [Chloroflexota bacterium]
MKKQLRKEYRALRSSLVAKFRKQASSRICQHIRSWSIFQRAEVVLTYIPMNGEVDLLPLLAGDSKRDWVIPRIHSHSRMTLHPYHPQKLVRHKYGMLEPDVSLPSVPPSRVDLVLVPGLAFDLQGWRLGYGGGFYDVFLSESPGLDALGVTYHAFLKDELLHMDHDIPVQHLVTEEGMLHISLDNRDR